VYVTGNICCVADGLTGQDLRTASLSTLNGLINAVAPPIAEHEVIQVTLSHDMEGYDGIESIVYRALAKVNVTLPTALYPTNSLY